jgi:serine/threonine protein kinase/tetratricopeptide (TPR) repeat protein
VFPGPGDEIFLFRLRRELGRGAFARVLLAEQADLASRPVVLKFTTIEGSEPQTLAQLQHTNIVPIYSVHEDRNLGLRAVCMPYFGGASFSHVLQALWSKTPCPRQGQELLRALESAQAPSSQEEARTDRPPSTIRIPSLPPTGDEGKPAPGDPVALGIAGPTPLDLLGELDYVRAIAWIVARLADGLQHAHQRGVLHHDIKPSNILIGADGQPMLLDFNLAGTMHDEQAQTVAVLGGTVAYMAPEHLRALMSKDPALHRLVDHRSDIYSLGMVLFEALTGQSPFLRKGSYSALPVLIELMALERTRTVPSVRQKRADVPWSLESILRKCLLPDPAQRYQQASHLAVDLRRFLDNLPLRHAPELSRLEQARKWLRRHPRLTSSGTVAVVAAGILVGVAVSLAGIRRHLAAAQEQVEIHRASRQKRAFEEGSQRAQCLVNTTAELSDHLNKGRAACREALNLYQILDRDDWQEQPAWRRLGAEERQRLGEDARELLLLLASSLVRSTPKNPATLEEALALLDRAERIHDLSPSRALWEDRASYLQRQGNTALAQAARSRAREIPVTGVRDRYLLALSYVRNGDYAGAIHELNEALNQNPRHYWSFFQRGICYQELGKTSQAAGDFGVCIGLWPEFALGYFNRGYNLDQSRDWAGAITDYTAALARDPSFVPAYFNRGMAYLQLRRYKEALADLQKVTQLGHDDPALHAWKGVALEGLRRFTEADTSFRTALARGSSAPEDVQIRIRLAYGFAVCNRLPEAALAAFDAVLAPNRDHPEALYGRAMILAEKGRVTEAIAQLDRAIRAKPGLLEARRCWAVLQARRGNLEPATEEINACLAKAPDSGSILYAAACVAAWVCERAPDDQKARQARAKTLDLLAKAFARGYGKDKAGHDPDLAGFPEDPDFQRLLKSNR